MTDKDIDAKASFDTGTDISGAILMSAAIIFAEELKKNQSPSYKGAVDDAMELRREIERQSDEA